MKDAENNRYNNSIQKTSETESFRKSTKVTILVLDNRNNRVPVSPENVGYFSYVPERKVWEMHCADGNTYTLRHGVNSSRLLQLYPNFEQVHKSFIVNIDFLSRIEDSKVYLNPPFDISTGIPVSRHHRNALYSHFCQL